MIIVSGEISDPDVTEDQIKLRTANHDGTLLSFEKYYWHRCLKLQTELLH